MEEERGKEEREGGRDDRIKGGEDRRKDGGGEEGWKAYVVGSKKHEINGNLNSISWI